jgi:hypothetical protein
VRRRAVLLACGAAVAVAVSGCAGAPDVAIVAPDASIVATPIGTGKAFRPAPLSAGARDAQPVAGLRCGAVTGRRFGAHIELFARGRVVVVPAGIGIAPPHRRDGAYVDGGRCHYPLRTREPTGVIEIEHGTRASVGDLFDLWGQPLSRRRLAGFSGDVRAAVGGREWRGDPRAIPLTPHAQIVLQVGPRIAPHPSYRFPPGL